jgi:hypothetical protein
MTTLRTLALSVLLAGACAGADTPPLQATIDGATATLSAEGRPLAVYRTGPTPIPHVHELFSPAGVNVLLGDAVAAKAPHANHFGVFFGFGLTQGATRYDFFHGPANAKQVPTATAIAPAAAQRAGLVQTLVWTFTAAKVETPLAVEERQVDIRRLPGVEATLLEWRSVVSARSAAVEARGYDFEGIGVRLLNPDIQPMTGRPDFKGNHSFWSGPWLAFSYHPEPGRQVTVALFKHPANTRGKNWCACLKPTDFGYLGAGVALDMAKPTMLELGAPWQQRYLVAVWDGRPEIATVDAAYKTWLEADAVAQPKP